MKWHITSWLFTKLDDFLPFVIYMVEWSLHNKKLCFLLIHNSWKTEIIFFFQSLNHVDFYLKPWFLIKSSYYIVPSPSTALLWRKQCIFSLEICTIFYKTLFPLFRSLVNKSFAQGFFSHIKFRKLWQQNTIAIANSQTWSNKK